MRGITSDPFREMDRLKARLRGLLDATFAPAQSPPDSARWTPRSDIIVSPNEVTLRLEICGTQREEMDISLRANVLTITGHRPSRVEEIGEEFLQVERPVGRFSRSFTLAWQPTSMDAELEHGVLLITLRR